MATAQDAYKVMVRDHLSPKLRANGFKGSAGAYELPSQSHWVVLGVQASAYSSKDEVKFTVNCQAVPRDVWEEARVERTYLGKKPKPNTIAGGFLWHSRIGKVMPAGQDKWWSLRPSDNAEVLAGEVAAAVRDHLLPAIRRDRQRSALTTSGDRNSLPLCVTEHRGQIGTTRAGLSAVPVNVLGKFHESSHDVGQGTRERPKNNPQITAEVWVCTR